MRKLIDQLNIWTDAYNKGTPMVSDKEWDLKYFELKAKEEAECFVYPDSPTRTIHYEEVDKLKKVKHNQNENILNHNMAYYAVVIVPIHLLILTIKQ